MARNLRAVVDMCALALLVALDVRDVWYKVRWLGPDDRFVFPAGLRAVLADSGAETLSLSSEGTPTQANTTGWSSFLGSCASLTPFHGGHFQHALATDCLVSGDRNDGDEVVVNSLILTSDVRVDAMAWAACRLLHLHRRPPVCHENLVTDFLQRYQLAAPHVGLSMMVPVMSNAEGELLGLLEVVSKSSPLSAVVCVSGFEFERTNDSTPHGSSTAVNAPLFYGCGSPNHRLSAFAGRFATALATLQSDKTWLTIDDVTVLDMHFRIRQNARTSYKVTEHSAAASEGTPSTKSLVLETHAAINLSCSGVLYNLMIVVDIALLVVHAWSSLELSRAVNRSRSLHSEPETIKAQMNRLSFFACSLARSTPVVVLTLSTTCLSWLLVLPNSVVLQFSHSPTAKFHAYMTMLRLWSLLLVLVNTAWDIIVLLDEKRAYYVASRTFVASWELAAIVLSVFYLLRSRLFALRSAKHELEHQRFTDALTFSNVLTMNNAYGEEDFALPGGDLRSAPTLWAIYSRLVQLLFLSLLVVVAILVARYVLFMCSHKKNGVVASSSSADSSALAVKRGSFGATMAVVAGYTRLPLEELMDVPIRAKNLVRYGDNGAERALERTVGSERFLWTVQHLAHGVLVESKHFLGARRGFLHVLPSHLPADGRGIAAARDVDDEEPSGSPKRRRYVSPLR